MENPDYSYYLRTLLVSVVVAFTAVAGLNLFVDPWGLFGTPRVPGVTARKPEAGDYVRLSKPYQVMRAAPDFLILGNSRAELGLNPKALCVGKVGGAAFVLAVPGSSVYLQYRLTQHAVASKKPDLVLIALDAINFFTSRDPAAATDTKIVRLEWEGRLSVNSDGHPNRFRWITVLKDYADGLFSLAATVDSFRTLAKQDARGEQNRTETGFHDATAYYEHIVRMEGQEVLFRQRMNELNKRYANAKWRLQRRDGLPPNAWNSLENLIELSRREDFELVLIINPLHARHLELLHSKGLWPLVVEWRQELVEIIAERVTDIRLIDFTGYDVFSTEELPHELETHSMLNWFWEPSHYRQELGNLILSRALPERCAGSVAGDVKYGVEISIDNIEGQNQRIRAERQVYLATQKSTRPNPRR
mgnify:CR=1 FL=1